MNSILLIAHAIINLASLYWLIRDGSKPYRIWAWMMTIFALPAIGVLLYLTFGINRRKRKLFDLKKFIDEKKQMEFLVNYQRETEHETVTRKVFELRHQKLINLLTKGSKSPITFKNKILILNDGQETFDAIFEACRQAKESIELQYYIFIDGLLAEEFESIFTRKRMEGVKVRILYDAIGSWTLSDAYIKRLRHIGVDIYPFLPLRWGTMGRTNYRNHRKILIVDGKIGFTGGINVDDKYIKGDPKLGHWTDTHLCIEGMAVNFLKLIFYKDWYFVSNENLFNTKELIRKNDKGNVPVQIVPSGPDSDYANILQQYLYIIGTAQKYVYIANSYIVPDESMLLVLKSTALSGVDVRLVIPQNSDSRIIKWSIRANFDTLLDSGVKIYLYQPGFLHSKIILSDDTICSIGTANLDIRSFEQNFEVNAVIYDRTATTQLKKTFIDFIENSARIDPEEYRKRPRKERAWESLARLVSPVM